MILQRKGCPNATTAHRLLYKSYPTPNGTFRHLPKFPLDNPYRLIVVDEISMLPKVMWELLLRHGIHVLALGDPGQLPPIGDDNQILASPHIFLDEIMRQEAESEIIRLSMKVREGKTLSPFQGKEVRIIPKSEVVTGLYTWADQIICGKNTTRRNINEVCRKLYLNTSSNEPLPNDKCICLRNDWERQNGTFDVLVNGSMGYLKNVSHTSNPYFQTYTIDFLPDIYYDMDDEEFDNLTGSPSFEGLTIDKKLLLTGEPSINQNNFRKIPKNFHPKQFDFGYCITAWKSQGSEWGKVLLFEEDFPYDKEDKIKFLYTAITRAVDKLVIVLKE